MQSNAASSRLKSSAVGWVVGGPVVEARRGVPNKFERAVAVIKMLMGPDALNEKAGKTQAFDADELTIDYIFQ